MKYILIILSLIISHTASAQLEKRLDSVIHSSILQGEPGIALYVETNGETMYNKGFGMADVGSLNKIKPNTNFRLASVSKQFTAMCILLLELEQKISFDDPISHFLPELPPSIGDKVLVRHLITHTSGIIDYEEVMDPTITTPLLDLDVLNILSTQNKTYSNPGTEFRYSNSAYALLALIVERVSGQTFPEFMKERIFNRLKMKKSLVYEATTSIPNRSFGFARDKNLKLYANDQSSTSAIKGDGGVYTSLDDYKKYKLPSDYPLVSDGTLPIIEINPVQDLEDLGYISGQFSTQYNFNKSVISGPTPILFIDEISEDRTEIRFNSTILSESQITSWGQYLGSALENSNEQINFILNFLD
jgi:CubicO group peptidase (beta-lactamase class C family)